MTRAIILAICACFAAGSVGADDFDAARPFSWHQWRGPFSNGVAPHGDPSVHWDEDTNIQWKVEITGEGNSTPVVWGDRIFVSAAVETERAVDSLPPLVAEPPGGYKTPRPTNYFRFVVICLDRNEISSWSTPLVVEHQGVTQLIVNATRRVISYDLADGRICAESQVSHRGAAPTAALRTALRSWCVLTP